jgi:hypothetical protein
MAAGKSWSLGPLLLNFKRLAVAPCGASSTLSWQGLCFLELEFPLAVWPLCGVCVQTPPTTPGPDGHSTISAASASASASASTARSPQSSQAAGTLPLAGVPVAGNGVPGCSAASAVLGVAVDTSESPVQVVQAAEDPVAALAAGAARAASLANPFNDMSDVELLDPAIVLAMSRAKAAAARAKALQGASAAPASSHQHGHGGKGQRVADQSAGGTGTGATPHAASDTGSERAQAVPVATWDDMEVALGTAAVVPEAEGGALDLPFAFPELSSELAGDGHGAQGPTASGSRSVNRRPRGAGKLPSTWTPAGTGRGESSSTGTTSSGSTSVHQALTLVAGAGTGSAHGPTGPRTGAEPDPEGAAGRQGAAIAHTVSGGVNLNPHHHGAGASVGGPAQALVGADSASAPGAVHSLVPVDALLECAAAGDLSPFVINGLLAVERADGGIMTGRGTLALPEDRLANTLVARQLHQMVEAIGMRWEDRDAGWEPPHPLVCAYYLT